MSIMMRVLVSGRAIRVVSSTFGDLSNLVVNAHFMMFWRTAKISAVLGGRALSR